MTTESRMEWARKRVAEMSPCQVEKLALLSGKQPPIATGGYATGKSVFSALIMAACERMGHKVVEVPSAREGFWRIVDE